MTVTATADVETTRDNPAARVLWRTGAASLIAGPLLFFAGNVTAPVQDSETQAGYVESLARDPMLTQVSALLLHYGNIFIGVGALLLPLLVRGRKGAIVTIVGSLMMALGFLNISGNLLSDWWIMELGRNLPVEQAVALAEGALGHGLLQVWNFTEMLSLLGVVVAQVGLARAGVIGWWAVPVPAICLLGAFALPLSMPVLISAVVGAAFAPLVVAGVRGLRRPAQRLG
ncbi:hypothetical protein AB0F81_18880 [Actinoplanes sp. NPDC024001]|uniref:hypothetical protein n=1 Tax=Actinoplanes sp. NPDC024001 TaxID=3154598 RepID=UPI0033F8C74B